MVRLRNREQTGSSYPLIVNPQYVRGSYRWLQDHDNEIENNLSGSQGLEFFELFSVDGARKGTQQKLCAPWFQHYSTDDLCSVPIHTMAADFKQQYKALPCVTQYLRKEVRCNSSHPDLGCVCGTASCYAPNLWLEGKDKAARERLSVAHAMLDVSIINRKKGISERKYLYLPVARCYEFIGNKLHFETNLDLGPQDKPIVVFVPMADGSGWVTHTLVRWRYQRTQYGIYEHMARHLKHMGLDMFPAVTDSVAATVPAPIAAAPAAPPAAAARAAAGEGASCKSASRSKPPAAVAGRAASISRAAVAAAEAAAAEDAAPPSKKPRLSSPSIAAAAATPASSRKHKARSTSGTAAAGSPALRSRAAPAAAAVAPAGGTMALGQARTPAADTKMSALHAAAVAETAASASAALSAAAAAGTAAAGAAAANNVAGGAAGGAAASAAAGGAAAASAAAASAAAASAAAAGVAAAPSGVKVPSPAALRPATVQRPAPGSALRAAPVAAPAAAPEPEPAAAVAAAAAASTNPSATSAERGVAAAPAAEQAAPSSKPAAAVAAANRDVQPGAARLPKTVPTDTATSSESGVLTSAADAAASPMASRAQPTDCWAALSAMLQPTLAAQETVFSSASRKRHLQQPCRVPLAPV